MWKKQERWAHAQPGDGKGTMAAALLQPACKPGGPRPQAAPAIYSRAPAGPVSKTENTWTTYRKGAIVLAEEIIAGQACGLYNDPKPLPESPVPAMAYVPYQQWCPKLHSAEQALDAGTLFPVLDKPFYGRRGAPR